MPMRESETTFGQRENGARSRCAEMQREFRERAKTKQLWDNAKTALVRGVPKCNANFANARKRNNFGTTRKRRSFAVCRNATRISRTRESETTLGQRENGAR